MESLLAAHYSLYGGISACPTRNSPTFTCGLRPLAYRMLVTTISSQSRQEITMPTSNNPPRPSNPHSEGELHQSELQQKAAPQSLEDAAPNETSTEATTITSSLREKASIESIPAANHTQKPEKITPQWKKNQTPQNSSEKKTDFYNFFSDSPKKKYFTILSRSSHFSSHYRVYIH